MNNVEIGSVILNMVENVPTFLSGATLWNIIDQEIQHVENVTGDSIGTSVADKYQPPIISLAASQVVKMMELQGADVSSIKLGDFTINKGSSSSTAFTSQGLRVDGEEKLNALGTSMSYYKALG